MAPFYLLGLFYSEGALYFVSRRPRLLALWILGTIGFLLYIEYWSSGPSYAREARPVLSFFVMLWIVSVPVGILSAASLLIRRARRRAVQQMLVLVAVTLVVFFWPLFALHSVCASGLDCL
jgi:hypothetical protein